MSRSKRKPIIKDKPRNRKASTYYRRIRRVIKSLVKSGKEDLPLSEELVNQYDYCDYIIGKDGFKEEKDTIKYSRK